MKRIFTILLLFSVVVSVLSAPPILRQFGTTNTPSVLTNIIQSISSSGQIWTNSAGTVSVIAGFGATNVDVSPRVFLGTDRLNYSETDFLDYKLIMGDETLRVGTEISRFVWEQVSNPSFTNYATFLMEFTAPTNNPTSLARATIKGRNTTNTSTITLSSQADTASTASIIISKNSDEVFAATGILVTGNRYQITSSTNQLIFGATNSAPATPGTIAKWVSVQINGEGVAYRIPLYQ